jgi:hypothetical protein
MARSGGKLTPVYRPTVVPSLPDQPTANKTVVAIVPAGTARRCRNREQHGTHIPAVVIVAVILGHGLARELT